MDNPSVASDQTQKKSPFDELSRDELASKCKGLLALAQKAKQAKSELQNELESYKLKLEKCESEKKASGENIQTLQELVDSLTEQKLNFITEVDTAHSKVKTLTRKCDNYEQEIQKYKADIIVRDKKFHDVGQKLSDLDSEIISLKRQNKRLLDENEQLISQLTEIEAKTTEFNNIGLQQQQQLKILEENVQKDESYKSTVEILNSKVKELEAQVQKEQENNNTYEMKIQEITEIYETEKLKKEKANIKLRSYKDKILKCAACINQLKNSRFILSKTVKEYSENIPKWQNDLIKASKVLDEQLSQVNTENSSLKEKLQLAEEQINQFSAVQKDSEKTNSKISELSSENSLLKSEILNLKEQFDKAMQDNSKVNKELSRVYNESEDFVRKITELSEKNNKCQKEIDKLKKENKDLSDSLKQETHNNEGNTNLLLQIKALESEKSILVKEKLNARDSVLDLENRNKVLAEQVTSFTTEIQTINSQLQILTQEKLDLEKNHKAEKESAVNMFKCEIRSLQDQCDRFKKEYDDLQDLNGILREEVETLKLSLEQPNDECDNLSDQNASLQADVVKLETKLSAYKQENSSLLSEVKESRNKIKEYDSLLLEYENAKSKLLTYKTENSELLNEMKEINQVLKERGEAISKLQKAVAEMELLVETLEKDRDNVIQDKADLEKKIDSLETTLKNAEQKTQESNDYTNQLIAERDNAIKELDRKEDFIASLKSEIDKLKQQNSIPTEIPMEDNMSTSTISKAEEHARMKDLDETFEEKYSKLRIFALKLKKKLNETVNQLQNSEQDKARMEKLLNEKAMLESKSDVPLSHDVIDGTNRDDERSIKNLQEKIDKLTDSLEAAKQDCSELEKVKAELTSKSQHLAAEIESHKVTKDNLEKARRDVKKKNVLSLEMEDYERSMKELTSKMEENKKKMVQMESTIDTQEATITAMKTQIKLLEEQIKTEETQCRHLKEELQHAVEESKEKENVISVKNGIISKLELDLEDEKRKNEESDMELTSVLSDKEKVIMSLGEEKAELNNKVKRMEFKCAELNENLRILNIELADLKTEYTSYKVRAQAVLRQNQMVDHSQEEQLKEEAAALKAQIETLTLKLATTQEQLAEQRSETENGRRRAAEASNEATRAQQRTARLHADLTRLSQQLETERSQHKLQISTLTQCYKTQINELETKLQKETENLKKQLMVVQENATVSAPGMSEEPINSHYMLPVMPKDENSDGEMDINVSMIPREEGEGSESAPSPPPLKSYMTAAGSGRSPVPLERLLEEGVPDDEALDTASLALTPEQEISDLKRKLLAQQQRVKHVTVLLAESERECARLSQLSELLKAELRRARGTTRHAHNAEYMKNVTLKFLTLPPGDERGRLVPVLQKILTLTQEETQKIQAIAKGMDPNPSKGWGSYLPWPGGK